jgi:hypothetical protein|tara:strand:+ start:647 stop:793 length:147 start_codon:yes stop_codon:yes gene_type:complete
VDAVTAATATAAVAANPAVAPGRLLSSCGTRRRSDESTKANERERRVM